MEVLKNNNLSLYDYDLVIFDCDGTLVDSEPISNEVIAQMCMELGISMTTERSISLFAGKTFAHIEAYIEAQLGQPPSQDFHRRFRALSKSAFETKLQMVPGVRSFIEQLHIPYCVASNGPREKMEVTLKVTGLQQYFPEDRVFSAYDIQSWKPDPKLFLYAAEQTIGGKAKVLVFEDSMTGLEAAKAAGMDCMVFCQPEKFHIFKSEATGVFHDWQLLQSLYVK